MAIATAAWNAPRLAPLVLISGGESILADRALRALRAGALAENPTTEVSEISASAYEGGTLESLAGPSLFGDPRFIVVTGAEQPAEAFTADFEGFCAYPHEDVWLVVCHAGGVGGKKVLTLARAATGAIEVSCQPVKKDADKMAIVSGEFAAAGKRIEPQALKALVDAFSNDLAELLSSANQLIADVEGDVTAAHIKTYFGGRNETTAFEVADAAISGNIGRSLLLMRQSIQSGTDPVPMVAAFAMKIRLMAKVYRSQASSADLAGKLGAAPWQIDQARRDAKNWSHEQLRLAMQAVAYTDAAVKGRDRDPEYAVERLVRAVASRVPITEL